MKMITRSLPIAHCSISWSGDYLYPNKNGFCLSYSWKHRKHSSECDSGRFRRPMAFISVSFISVSFISMSWSKNG